MKRFQKVMSLLVCLTLITSLFSVMPVSATGGQSEATLYDIRVSDLVAPIGLDNPNPVFSWKMQSDVTGQQQTAYSITVTKESTNTVVWNSDWVLSGNSIGITYAGTALESSTKYSVSIVAKDKDGKETNPITTTFETGLFNTSDWNNAKWIGIGETTGSTATKYTIDFDFIIDSANAGFFFGSPDSGNFYMWQVSTYESKTLNQVWVRPHIYRNGSWFRYPGLNGGQNYDVTSAIGYSATDLIGKLIHIQIDVDGKTVKTYFGTGANKALACTYTNDVDIPLYKIGFRHNSDQNAKEVTRFDNFLIQDNSENIIFQDNFSDPSNPNFTGGTITNGMLQVGEDNPGGDQRVYQVLGGKSAPVYRKSFTVQSETTLKSAQLYTAGLGVYETYINGQRVGNKLADNSIAYDELKPGFTEAKLRQFYNAYDVTWMLQNGQNAISAVTTSGWWTGRVAGTPGKSTAYKAKLLLTYSDNSHQVLVTDNSWKTYRASPIVAADIFDGETYDANISTDWMNADFDDSDWNDPVINTEFTGELVNQIGSPVTVRKDLELTPKTATVYNGADNTTENQFGKIHVVNTYGDESFTLNPGEVAVIDLGQNHAGWEYFEAEAQKGAVLTVRHGEMLNDNNGLKSRGNDGPEGSIYTANLRGAQTRTKYTFSGNGIEKYHPSATFYGYRYMEIKVTAPVTFHKIRGQVVTSVEKDLGFMETSNKDVNQLISNSRWGQYSNYLSIPTDCPQRDERQGWSADTQNFAAAGSYLAFSKSFLMKWMQDMQDAQQKPNEQYPGAYPGTAPRGEYGGADWGGTGWTDAGVIVPYTLYAIYGDTSVIKQNWDSMVFFMDTFMASTNKKGGRHVWGDWLAYESNDDEIQSILGVAYYAWDALLMSKMAQATGDTASAAKYQAVYEVEKEYFQQQFVKADGTLIRGEQSVCLYALFLDLLPNENSVTAVTNQLVTNIESKGNRLQTGFLGTEIIMNTLTKIGRTDIAYKLLLQHENPSWLYSIDQGATTIWERWNSYTKESGFGDVGMNSFNHYSYGSVAEWMFRYMGGIGYDIENPGFKHTILAPSTDQLIHFVNSSYDSAYGKITSNWKFTNGTFAYDAVIPANTSATIILPIEDISSLTVNGKAYTDVTTAGDGIVFTGESDGTAKFEAVAGSFHFETDVTEYKYVTVKKDNATVSGNAYVSVNGGEPQALPIILKVGIGDQLTLQSSVWNDVDYAPAGWVTDNGTQLSATDTISYTVTDDATIIAEFKWTGYNQINIGATVTAPQVNASWAATQLCDGILNHTQGNNGWSSNSKGSNPVFTASPVTAVINMGEEKDFDRFQIYPRTDLVVKGTTANFPVNYKIEISNDGSTYTPVYSTTSGNVVFQKPLAIQLEDVVTAQYVRLTVYAVNQSDENNTCYVQLSEFGIYNTTDIPDPDPSPIVRVEAPESVSIYENFTVTVTTLPDVYGLQIYNEVGSKMGLIVTPKPMVDGNKVWEVSMNIGTKGEGRTFTFGVKDEEGQVKVTDKTVSIDVLEAKPAGSTNLIHNARFGSAEGFVNEPMTLTVTTDVSVNKLSLYNENGGNIGISSATKKDVGGVRTWTLVFAVGSKGDRTFTIKGVSTTGMQTNEYPVNIKVSKAAN